MGWDALNEVVQSLDKKISEAPPAALAEQLSVLEKAAETHERVSATAVPSVKNPEELQMAFEALAAQLRAPKNDGEREKALVELGNLGNSAAIPTLLTYVDAKYSTGARSQAMQSLAKLRAREAVPVRWRFCGCRPQETSGMRVKKTRSSGGTP